MDLPPSLTAYALLLIAAPAPLFGTPQSPLMGMPRYVLVAFPVFIVLGSLLGDRRILGGWLALSAAYVTGALRPLRDLAVRRLRARSGLRPSTVPALQHFS